MESAGNTTVNSAGADCVSLHVFRRSPLWHVCPARIRPPSAANLLSYTNPKQTYQRNIDRTPGRLGHQLRLIQDRCSLFMAQLSREAPVSDRQWYRHPKYGPMIIETQQLSSSRRCALNRSGHYSSGSSISASSLRQLLLRHPALARIRSDFL